MNDESWSGMSKAHPLILIREKASLWFFSFFWFITSAMDARMLKNYGWTSFIRNRLRTHSSDSFWTFCHSIFTVSTWRSVKLLNKNHLVRIREKLRFSRMPLIWSDLTSEISSCLKDLYFVHQKIVGMWVRQQQSYKLG